MKAKKAFAIVHFFPRGTRKQYEAVLVAVHPGRTKLPKGQLLHVAGPSKGGWTIMAVHDSKKSWVTFRNKVLRPAMRKGIKGGFKGQPRETEIAVKTLLA